MTPDTLKALAAILLAFAAGLACYGGSFMAYMLIKLGWTDTLKAYGYVMAPGLFAAAAGMIWLVAEMMRH